MLRKEKNQKALITKMNLAFFQETPVMDPVPWKENMAIQPCIFNENKGLVSFAFDVYPEHYLQNHFVLKTSWSVRKKDKSELTAADVVAPIAGTHHTMWSDVQLKLNDCLIEACNGNYAYKAYFLSAFAHADAVKNTNLAYKELLYLDDCGLS